MREYFSFRRSTSGCGAPSPLSGRRLSWRDSITGWKTTPYQTLPVPPSRQQYIHTVTRGNRGQLSTVARTSGGSRGGLVDQNGFAEPTGSEAKKLCGLA